MRLATYDPGSGPRLGLVREDRLVDVSALLGHAETFRDVQALLESSPDALAELQEATGRSADAPSVPLPTAKLRAPVLRPPTVRDFMIYEEHATRQGTRQQHEAWYRMPVFYFSNTLRIFGTDEVIPFPSACRQLDYELELACVVGRDGSDVEESEAMDYIAGFLILNDWSCRDLQWDEQQVGLGTAKGKDSATSLGPWLVTVDEMEPYLRSGRLHVECTIRVNGETWLEKGRGGDGSQAQHTWGSLIERASHDSRIAAGDIIATGTVGGGSIGEAIRKDYPSARFLEPGDVVELEVEGLGVLRNRLVEGSPRDDAYRYLSQAEWPMPERGIARDYIWSPSR